MLYFLLILILGYYENKVYKTGITPLMAFIGPTTFLVFFSKILDSRLDLKEYQRLLFIIGMIWFFIGVSFKFIFDLNFKKKKKLEMKKIPIFIKKSNEITIFSLLIAVIQTINNFGIANTKGNIGGIFAHIFLLVSPFCLIIKYDNKKISNKVYFIILFPLLLFLSKYQIFLFFLPFILLKIYKQKFFFSLKNIFIIFMIFIVVVFVFSSVYYLNFKLKGTNVSLINFFEFVKSHIKFYFISPVYIGEYLLRKELVGEYKVAFAPFFNILKVLSGDKNYINPILKSVTYLEIKSNVGGLIPELVYSIGYKGMYIYIVILGFFSYTIENFLLKDERWIFTSLILKSTLILCFFGNVFSVLGYIEKIFGSFILTIIFIIYQKIKIKRYKNE